jgi:membrane protein DedA with SNARE-associated domain
VTGLYALDVGSALSYVMAVLVPALDALVPVLPSETVVIALGVATAGSADPRIGLLVALAAFGAFLGDNAAYLVGRRFGSAVDRRLFAGERGARRRAWAQRSLDRFGTRIIIACRFIPGGRTSVTLTCGLIGYPRRRFGAATACAGIVWASYAFFLGRLGGKVFEHQPWIGLLLALGLAVAVSVLIEAARRAWRWHANARHRIRRALPAGQQRQAGLQAAWEDPPAADCLSPVGAGPMTAHDDLRSRPGVDGPGSLVKGTGGDLRHGGHR